MSIISSVAIATHSTSYAENRFDKEGGGGVG